MKTLNRIILVILAVAAQNFSVMCAPHSPATISGKHEKGFCSLNPPSNLHPTQISSSWANLQWDLVPGATQYLIKTYDVVSGVEVHTALVAGNISSVQVTWPDNCSLNLESRAWSIDNGGQSGTYSSTNYQGVILDLLTLGYSYTAASGEPCIVTSGINSCSNIIWGQGTQTSFKISPPPGSEQPDGAYTVEGCFVGGQPKFSVRYNPNKFYSFSTDGSAAFIKSGATDVATLEPVFAPNANNPQAYLRRVDNFPGFTLSKQGVFFSFGPGGTKSSNDRFATDGLAAAISSFPNPFNSIVKVRFPEPLPTASSIALYDLLGALQIQLVVPAGQQQITLNTNDLMPGMYILKMEYEDRVQSVKLLKTQ